MTITDVATERTYQPRGSARRIFSMRDSELVVSGPAGTGKSRACLEKVFAALLKYPGARALFVRKTHTSLTSTALVTFREHVATEALAHGDVEWYSGSAEEPPGYRFENGSRINVGGMDKSDKIMSSEYDLIYVQECTELREEDWDKLLTRLRNGVMPYQQMLGDCNPSHPKHWLKQRSNRGDTVMLHAKHTENPRYFDEHGEITEAGRAYMAILDKLTGIRKDRLRDGKWVAAEGAIYGEEWDEPIHVIPRFEIPDEWPRYWVVDFGFDHPFVCQMWAEDGDGRLFMYREFYMSERIVENHARQILRAVTKLTGKPGEPNYDEPLDDLDSGLREWAEPEPVVVLADHDKEGRVTFELHSGLKTKAATKNVLDGIQAVQGRLIPAGDGRPRIFFFDDALHERDKRLQKELAPTCTVEEVPGYVWDEKDGPGKKERPIKEQDDGLDCVRYMVAYLDIEKSKPDVRWL